MTADVTAQAWAVVQAIGLGLAAGLLYDLFRVLRVRVHVPLLGPLLDLLFWITLTAVLFVWSQWAWGGMVRLYGAVFLFFGGCVYFWLLSSGVLWVGYRLADLVTFVLKILVLPLIALNQLRKKIKKLAKNIFLSGAKWGRINQITQEMERSARRRRERERGGEDHAPQTNRDFNQGSNRGAVGLSGYLSAGSAWTDPEHQRAAADGEPVEKQVEELVVTGRHDPCIVPRAVPVVEAVTALTILDLLSS